MLSFAPFSIDGASFTLSGVPCHLWGGRQTQGKLAAWQPSHGGGRAPPTLSNNGSVRNALGNERDSLSGGYGAKVQVGSASELRTDTLLSGIDSCHLHPPFTLDHLYRHPPRSFPIMLRREMLFLCFHTLFFNEWLSPYSVHSLPLSSLFSAGSSNIKTWLNPPQEHILFLESMVSLELFCFCSKLWDTFLV